MNSILTTAVANLLDVGQVVFLKALCDGEREAIADAVRNNVLPKSSIDLPRLIELGYIDLIDERKDPTLVNIRTTILAAALFGEASSSELFEEFVDAYPRFLYIDGKRVAALNADMAELEAEYDKLVIRKGAHARVLKALNWARENHEIHMGIKLWLGSRQWKSIEEIMNDTTGGRLPSNNLL